MAPLMSHPRFKTLIRFADGELNGDRKEKTASHLARCSHCRERVASLRSIGEAAAQAPEREPPAGALEAILAHRESGDRVILPVATIGLRRAVPRPTVRQVVAAAAAILVSLGVLLLWAVPRGVAAGNSELRFTPASPTAGAEIRVEYRAGSLFLPTDTLRLRTRFRRPWDDSYNRGAMQATVTTLLPVGRGSFEGSFRLPDDVVYATFAVEDADGLEVDANQRRLWELLIHASDGRPLFESLEQRISDHMGRNWEVGRETARRLTDLYPERVSSWRLLASFQRESLGPEAFAELRAAHRQRYMRFHDSLSLTEPVNADQINAMLDYWWEAGGNDDELDPELWRYWYQRLKQEYPNHPTVLVFLENEELRRHRGDPDSHAATVERLWRQLEVQSPSRDRSTAMSAFITNTINVVAEATDPSWFERWVDRYRLFDRPTPGGLAHLVETVLERDDLRPWGLAELSKERARLESDSDGFRSLSVSRPRHRSVSEEQAAALLFAMSKGFLAAGDTTAAVDTLEVASSKAWSPEVDRLLGDVRLAMGDTLQAVGHLAAVAADPGTPESFADSVISLIGTGAALEVWHAATEEARDRMARQIMRHADPLPIADPVRLRDQDGAVSTLAELAGGRPLVVVMFSRHCPWAVQALPEIERVSEWAASRGGRVVLASEEEPADELAALLAEKDADLVPLFDFRRDATRAFSNFGTPQHYVVDSDGTLIFSGRGSQDISLIPLQIEALLRLEGTLPSGEGRDP